VHAWTPVPVSSEVILDFGGTRIRVIPDGGQWVAVEDVTSLFGEGDDPLGAAADLTASMFELLRDLTAENARLAPEIEAKREYLRRILPL
jgi:hypothetical protein